MPTCSQHVGLLSRASSLRHLYSADVAESPRRNVPQWAVAAEIRLVTPVFTALVKTALLPVLSWCGLSYAQYAPSTTCSQHVEPVLRIKCGKSFATWVCVLCKTFLSCLCCCLWHWYVTIWFSLMLLSHVGSFAPFGALETLHDCCTCWGLGSPAFVTAALLVLPSLRSFAPPCVALAAVC